MKTYRLPLVGLVLLLSGTLVAWQAPPQQTAAAKHNPASSAAQAPEIKPGIERWPIKTSLAEGADPAHAKSIAFADLIALGDVPGVKKDDPRYQDARIPAFSNSLNVKEGDIVTVRGWLHLIALETDGDYHIQISDSAASGDHCLIVEVPDPDPAFTATADLRPTFASIRDFLKAKTLANQDPSPRGSVMAHPPYVEVTGQLFYDDSHVGDPPRGKKGMLAATLWEVHPVVALKFAPKPAQ